MPPSQRHGILGLRQGRRLPRCQRASRHYIHTLSGGLYHETRHRAELPRAASTPRLTLCAPLRAMTFTMADDGRRVIRYIDAPPAAFCAAIFSLFQECQTSCDASADTRQHADKRPGYFLGTFLCQAQGAATIRFAAIGARATLPSAGRAFS